MGRRGQTDGGAGGDTLQGEGDREGEGTRGEKTSERKNSEQREEKVRTQEHRKMEDEKRRYRFKYSGLEGVGARGPSSAAPDGHPACVLTYLTWQQAHSS